MSQTTKNILNVIGVCLVVYVGYHIAVALLPWLILGAVIYGVYYAFGRKALTGGRRSLP